MARYFEKAGINAIHATAGCYEYRRFANPSTYQPAGNVVCMAEMVKEAVSIPVIAFGKLGNPELAEKVLQEEKADFIALARPFLADPEWPNKTRMEGGTISVLHRVSRWMPSAQFRKQVCQLRR